MKPRQGEIWAHTMGNRVEILTSEDDHGMVMVNPLGSASKGYPYKTHIRPPEWNPIPNAQAKFLAQLEAKVASLNSEAQEKDLARAKAAMDHSHKVVQEAFLREQTKAQGRHCVPEGTKHDGGKPRWDLLPWDMLETMAADMAEMQPIRWDLVPWDALREVVKVMSHGAAKYGDRNWEQGISFHRLFRAAIGHVSRWWWKEDQDAEWGLSHLAHGACCVLFLLTYEVRKMAKWDNRPRKAAQHVTQGRGDPSQGPSGQGPAT